MTTYLKQYGERCTGTNYLRFLLQKNCTDTVVLMHILGDKHSPPEPLEELWRATRQCPQPDVEFVSRATFATARYHLDEQGEREEVRRVAPDVASAFCSGRIGYLISIKDPYAWAFSMTSYLQWPPRPPRQHAERFAAECRHFNDVYRAWLALARRQPACIVRHEDLLENPEQAVDEVARTFALRRREGPFIDTNASMARQVWDSDALATMRQPFDRSFYAKRQYLDRLTALEREVVTATIDWSLLAGLGYEPLRRGREVRTAVTPLKGPPPAMTTTAVDAVAPRTFGTYRGAHANDTIVVCGCGTSLTQLEHPERFVTIGVNDVGRLFTPDYLVVLNPPTQFRGDRFRYVAESKAGAIFTHLGLRLNHPNVVRFRLGRRGGTEVGDGATLPYTRNSPYVALALAMFMGAKRIGIIGVDFTDDHFFARTGRHSLARELPHIDAEYKQLYGKAREMGIEVFNLSEGSRLTAFPKQPLAEFAGQPRARPADLKIVSYATTPVVGVPLILSRAIAAKTNHQCRTIWFDRTYGNGVKFEGDVEYRYAPDAAAELLSAADVVIVHNGKVAPQHSSIVASKSVVTLAHQGMWNVDRRFVERGYPGLVVAQYVATLPEFQGWTPAPNPMLLWEPDYAPGEKESPLTICYTPSVKHESYPIGHRLYSHGKGYRSTVRVLDRIAEELPVRLEIIRGRQVAHAESLAMKRRAHIVIDECVTGGYHRNSLEGLALGAVVVNGVGMIPGVADVIRGCTSTDAEIPFVSASLESLETTLRSLAARGEAALREDGLRNRRWIEQHWDFGAQWTRFWEPAIARALDHHGRGRLKSPMQRAPEPVAVPARAPVQFVEEPLARPAAEPIHDLTVAIPVGGAERLGNLRTCLRFLREAGVEQAVVVEMDHRPQAQAIVSEAGYRYVFAQQETVFHKARAMNAAIPMIATTRLLWLDADIVVTPGLLPTALQELDQRGLDCLVPYTSVRYLGEADSADVVAGRREPQRCALANVHFTRNGVRGGAVLVRTELVKRYGGIREEFIGWGGEDNAFFVRAAMLGRAATSENAELHLYHLHHPLSGGHAQAAAAAANPGHARNMALLQELRRLPTRDAVLQRFPPPPSFTASWLGTKRIACSPGAEEAGRELVRLYGAAVALCGAGEPHDALLRPDASRTAYESAIGLAATLALPAPAAVAAAAPPAPHAARVVQLDPAASGLDGRWPWADGSLDEVRAAEVLAYLPDKIRTMNELWRVLRRGGRAEVSVLTTDGPGAFADPKRVAFWNRASFEYYEDGHPVRERVAGRYGIAARFRILGERSEQTAEGPRLTLRLEAVKA